MNLFKKFWNACKTVFYVILTFWKYTWLPERWNFYPYICTLYPFICEWIEVGKSLKITIGPKILQKKVSSKIKIILTYILKVGTYLSASLEINLQFRNKDHVVEKVTKVYIQRIYVWKVQKLFHFSTWILLMKSPKNFEKIAILKIWWLLSSWGVKSQFAEIPFSGMIIFIFTHNAPLMLLFSPNKLYVVSSWYFDYFWEQWHLQKTTFAYMNQYFNDKLGLFLTKVSFVTSRKTAIISSKRLFFKILWGFHELHS